MPKQVKFERNQGSFEMFVKKHTSIQCNAITVSSYEIIPMTSFSIPTSLNFCCSIRRGQIQLYTNQAPNETKSRLSGLLLEI